MGNVLVRYKLKADKVTENEELVKEVYRQLHEEKPEGFRYATYKLADGVSFVHIASFKTEEDNHKFTSLPAFKNFQAHIKERCEELPVVNHVEEIGSYYFVKNELRERNQSINS